MVKVRNCISNNYHISIVGDDADLLQRIGTNFGLMPNKTIVAGLLLGLKILDSMTQEERQKYDLERKDG